MAMESPEWLVAMHSVHTAAACATALTKLTTVGRRRALSNSPRPAGAAPHERLRTEVLRLCDELDDCAKNARAALERAFAADSAVSEVKATDNTAGTTPQASAASKKTAKRKEQRKQRRARAAAGESRDAEMAGDDKPPPLHPPESPSPAMQHASSTALLQPFGSLPPPGVLVFGAGSTT